MSKTYQMPNVAVGQTVLWYPAYGAEPHAAIVSEVNVDSISVLVTRPMQNDFAPYLNVRHVHDDRPLPRGLQEEHNGIWEHTKTTKEYDALAQVVKDLQREWTFTRPNDPAKDGPVPAKK